MKIVALMPVRNEAWCIGLTLRVALQWCDHIVILLHACTDESHDLIIAAADQSDAWKRITILIEDGDCWDEMNHRQRLLVEARHQGATHIAHVDADEFLSANLVGVIRDRVESLDKGQYLSVPLYNVRGDLRSIHANGLWSNRVTSLAWADDGVLGWHGDRFHAREPQGAPLQPIRHFGQLEGGVIHLWGLSERRLKAKHALYKLTERLRWPNRCVDMIDQNYSWAIYDQRPMTRDQWTFRDTPANWLDDYDHWIDKYLQPDREPWQEQRCREIVAQHPGIQTGLDLFGVV